MRSRLTGLIVAASIAGLLAIGPTLATPATATDRSVLVQSGDTLTAIARRFGVSVERLVALNHLANANRIYAGQRLQLAAAAPAAPAAAAPPAALPSSPAAAGVHVVRPGEHLTGIARQHGTSVAALAAANRLPNPSYIRVGQRLVIPSTAAVATQPQASAPAAPAPAAASTRSHRVAPGEYLIGIARQYGTSVQAIMAANGMSNPSFIRAGDVLRIPGAAGAPAPASAAPAASPRNPAIPASMAERVQSRGAVRDLIVAEAQRFGVPASFALAVAWQESGWQQAVTSSAGAVGVMQLLPATGDWVGGAMLHQRIDLRDVRHNVRAGVRLLAHYLDRYDGDRGKVLAAYYQGQTAVDRHGIFNVTRPYIASILELERIFR